MTQKEKEKICFNNGYHSWQDNKTHFINFESMTEDYTEITGTLTCAICGATAELSGNWDSEEPEKKD